MQNKPTPPSLRQDLGLTETLSIIFNRIIGSGIFRTPAPIMLLAAGSVSLFYGIWLVGGIATLLGAFCYAELVAMMPKSGGPYEYLKAAYPPVVTFLRGWAMFFVSETGAIAAVSLFFAENGVKLLTQLGYNIAFPAFTEAFSAICIVFALTAANSFGVKLSGQLQNVFGLLKLLLLFSVPVMSFSMAWNPHHFEMNTAWTWASLITIGEGLRYSFFAYSGWEGATYVAEEVKNPSRNLPLSLLFGILAVMVMYLVVNAAYLNAISPTDMAAAKSVAVDAMVALVGTLGGIIVAIAIMFSTFSNVNTQILVKSRTWYAMARDGLFFQFMGKIHPKYQTPNNSMLAQAIWATVLIIFATTAENAYENIIDFFSCTSTIFNILTFASVMVLRHTMPHLHRPYKAWGYPFSLILVITIYVYFFFVTLTTKPYHSITGMLLTATGLIYYYAVVKKRTVHS